ncbi:hypothetical protein [Bradyrhizobium sp. F1.13.3]|uniref:hypothetical protein n=1 Tax=Bradyrhizobium sp. F1.13.3 TaxID=3156351 RepID=UPI003396DCE9
MAYDQATLPATGDNVAIDKIAGRDFQRVKSAFGAEGSATDVSSANPMPVDDADTQAGLAAILAKLLSAPATEAKQDSAITVLNAIGALLTTQAGYLDGIEGLIGTTNGKDFATQATLAAVLAKLIAAPSTEAKQDTLIAALGASSGAKVITDANGTVQQYLRGLVSQWIAGTLVVGAGENHLGEVGGNTAVAGGSITRQANTTAYALGQHIAAATAAAIPCAIARKNAGTGVITGVRLSKSGNVLTNASFRVHLFKTAPATLPVDAAAFAAGVSGVSAIALGYVDITMDQQYSDGAKGFASIQAKAFDAAAGSQNIYALIEARGAYTPASGETFTLALEALRD